MPRGLPVSPAPTGNDALADQIHLELDRILKDPTRGKPIGAGDWGAAQRAIAAFYAARNYAPLWLDDDRFSARARLAITRLARADEDGLDLSSLPGLSPGRAGSSAKDRAKAEVALSVATVAYALQATGARITPHGLSKDVTARPQTANPEYVLKTLASADDVDATLVGFNPPQDGYKLLRAKLASMRVDEPRAWSRVVPGPELKIGMSDPRVELIRARFGLGARGDAATSQLYDVRVASAVAAFQRVHGLKPDGNFSAATATALSGSNDYGRRQALLIANMEMWRWEPRDMGETRVEVNVPDYSLKLVQDGAIIHRARVIVGKPDTPTPIFSNFIKYLLLNPVWHVPESIVKKEMAPKFATDPNYFSRHGYKVSYAGDKLVVEQPPGEANALGRMLFLFPNEHAVYLHDTPQRALFAANFRALSHGCVRVEDPSRLAAILMGGARRGWSDGKVQSLLGDIEHTMSLPRPVPVHLQYFTEFVDENGALRERPDVYGLTAKVVSALRAYRAD